MEGMAVGRVAPEVGIDDSGILLGDWDSGLREGIRMGIMDDMALYALGYWMHESHPVRMEPFCLNEIQRKHPCSNCTDSCPQGIAVHEEAPDWSSCTNCDLCVTACPTQAMRMSGSRMDGMRSFMDSSSGLVVFSCDRVEACGGPEMRVACLGSLPWEQVAMAALDGRVVLRTSACKHCPQDELRERTRGLIEELKRFFGIDEFRRRILPRIPEDADVDGSAAERRRAFAGIAATVRRGASNLVNADDGQGTAASVEGAPDAAASPNEPAGGALANRRPDLSYGRAMLVERLMAAPADERLAVSWLTLIEDGNCRGCGICANMCPHHALSLRIPELDGGGDCSNGDTRPGIGSSSTAQPDNSGSAVAGGDAQCGASVGENESEGADSGFSDPGSTVASSRQALVHDASRCTQCGLCYMSCPNDNLGGWDELRTKELPALRAFPIEVVVCEKCGRPFKQKDEERRCLACSRMRFR